MTGSLIPKLLLLLKIMMYNFLQDGCKVEMIQEDIPSEANLQVLENGWRDRIFKAISLICGYPFMDD